MPSPFPGMDPYIEDPEIYADFHNNLATEIQGQLNAVIQPRYVARLIPHVTYELVEIARPRSIRPDLGVWRPQLPLEGLGGVAVAVPPAPVESAISLEFPLRLVEVEIHRTDTLELVTAIEILSPVNKKAGHDTYDEYQRKQRALLRSEAHLLEIDLLRGGRRPPLEQPVPRAPYYVVLSRAERRPAVEVWPIQLQDKLPFLPVPLLAPDPDAPLDLGAAVAAVYVRGGYATLIDYHRPPPPPPLTKAETTWMEGRLRQIFSGSSGANGADREGT